MKWNPPLMTQSKVDELLGEAGQICGLRALPWRDSVVPFTPVTPRRALGLCHAFDISRRPGPCREVCLFELDPGKAPWDGAPRLDSRRLWLMNQAGDLGYMIGERPWGDAQYILKVL
jgi:hypothetical protein